MIDVLLLGGCGLERVATALRARGRTAAVGAWTQTELVARLDPVLIYVDLFGFDVVAPLTTAAIAGRLLPEPDLGLQIAVVAALQGRALVFRGVRRPTAGAFGLIHNHRALDAALDRLAAVIGDQRVLDVAGLWARAGHRLDDVRFGLGHGEPADLTAAIDEATWIDALWAARARPPVKCIVVDLDGTLIHGRVTDDDLHDRNPAWLPDGEEPRHAAVVGWWRLDRGLHEALRIAQQRGIALALASRNDPAVVRARWRKRPLAPAGDLGAYERLYADLPDDWRDQALAAHPALLDALALGLDDFAAVRIGFGPKSEMCRDVADELGIGLDSVAFLDDSAFERAEVARHAPEVLVVDVPVPQMREVVLNGARFVPWDLTEAAARRADSYKSRAAVVNAADLEAFLCDLHVCIGLRRAGVADHPRVRELIHRTNQLALTAARPEIVDGDEVFVGWCRDRIADHGIVNAAIVRDGVLIAWATSCRVLPHRVASSFLRLLRDEGPAVRIVREDTGRNAATVGLIEESDAIAAWITVESK